METGTGVSTFRSMTAATKATLYQKDHARLFLILNEMRDPKASKLAKISQAETLSPEPEMALQQSKSLKFMR
jgi:hypothetical protein